MTKPTICHLGAWGKNWGDRAIQYALQNAVGREGYRWENMDIQRPRFTGYFDDLEDSELVLIGGGGLLWDKPELNSPSGWQWQVTPSNIEHLDVPIIVHAIGDTRFPYGDDQTGKKPEFKESLTILARKAISFSVRDELTQRILAEMDIKTTLCPDPALFISQPDDNAVPPGPPILGVCLAWDKAPWRWPGRYQGAATYTEYLDALSEALVGFVKGGWQLRPFCHIPADAPTVGFCTDVMDKAGMVPELDAASVWWFEQGDILKTIPRLTAMYSECTAVVSMRKHGIIIPSGLGVPVVGLGDMAEVKSICAQLGVGLVTSETASAEHFAEMIQGALDDEPNSYEILRAAHDRHISRIRGALE